jgi:hypothetical protein
MHPRLGEQVIISGVVVMHVSDDDIRHLLVLYAYRPQAFIHGTYQGASALLCLFRAESGIDDEAVLRANDGPDEIVQGHGPVVGIAAQEVMGGSALEVRVADSKYLVVDAQGIVLPD